MRITITARHTEIDNDLRAHTRELVEKVAKLIRRPHHAHVIFTEEHDEAGVEIAVHVPRGRVHVAKSQAADHRSALDAAIARVKRQLLDEKQTPRARRTANAPATTPRLKVGDLLARKGDPLQLELLTAEVGLDREIRSPEASSPGLVLAGYTARFVGTDRIHILGETEITYLASLDSKARRQSIETFLAYDLPCVIITKGQEPPDELVQLARDKGIPVIRTRLKTAEFYRRLKPFLADAFAPATTVHASLADVFGVGLLFLGRSGIGKSECVLDLVERGHRLVADDVVHVTRRGNDVLIGRGHELSQHYMEIRGVGLIDIRALFGVRAVRQQKRIEVVVQLEDWDATREYDRTGIDSQTTALLGVSLPLVTVPLNPGKNLTVICEVVAMHHLQRYSGVDSARQFNERLLQRMAERRQLQEYLEEDNE